MAPEPSTAVPDGGAPNGPLSSPPPSDSSSKTEGSGLYLRLSAGIGALVGKGDFPYPYGTFSGLAYGVSAIADLAVGAALAPGFYLGGGIWLSAIPSPSMAMQLNGSFDSHGTGYVTTFVLGPFMDWFPQQDSGFHLQAGAGVSFIKIGRGGSTVNVCDSNGILCEDQALPGGDMSWPGLGAMLGLGYDARINSQWSWGILSRVTYAAGQRLVPFVPGLSFAITYR